jgi:hypothetical protein
MEVLRISRNRSLQGFSTREPKARHLRTSKNKIRPL